jgi:hypothetical protein
MMISEGEPHVGRQSREQWGHLGELVQAQIGVVDVGTFNELQHHDESAVGPGRSWESLPSLTELGNLPV